MRAGSLLGQEVDLIMTMTRIVRLKDLPEPLSERPDTQPCSKCGRSIFWGRRAESEERPIPLDAEPNNAGHYMVSAFVPNQFDSAVVPRMSDVRADSTVVPVWDDLPAWSRRTRWTNHAEFCEAGLSATLVTVLSGAPTREPVRRVGPAESRRRHIAEMVSELQKALPGYELSPQLRKVCDDYIALKIEKQRLKRELIAEEARIQASRRK
jgi:hypothetical protein